MMDSLQKVWEVWETTDEYGRRGNHRGYYTTEAKAKEVAKGKGFYGGEGTILPVIFVLIEDDEGRLIRKYKLAEMTYGPFTGKFNIDPVIQKKEFIESGLAKLDDDERQALGLTKNVIERML